MKVCDPAVGSGHFLVSALNRIIELKSYLGCLFYYGSDERVTDYRITVENDDLKILDGQGNIFKYRMNNYESQRMQKTLFCEKRTIIENCLFGADLNENACSICRLRLWIELLKSAYYEDGKMNTLPNIDINIKSGDSIYNTKYVSPGQTIAHASFDSHELELLKLYKKLVTDYKEEDNKTSKKRIKDRIDGISKTIKRRIANSSYQVFSLFDDSVSLINEETNTDYYVQWDLDFPDLLDDSGRFVGFDCVVGNPPFIRLQEFENKYLRKISEQDYTSYVKEGDIYCLFLELGKKILRKNGYLTFITSRQWMRASYGTRLRTLLTTQLSPDLLVDLGPGVFDNANVDTAIISYKYSAYDHKTLACKASKYDIGNLRSFIEDNGRILDFSRRSMWIITTELEESIIEKVERLGTPIKDWDGLKINYGIKTGCNEAFVIDEQQARNFIQIDSRNAEIIKPMIRGQDLERYGCVVEQYLINVHNGVRESNIKPIDINDYPVLKTHLNQFYAKLKKRGDKGVTPYNLRNCAYLLDFENTKIIYSDISQSPKFFLDYKGIYCNNTTYIMSGSNLEYLCGCLNSKIYSSIFRLFYSGGGLGEDGYRYFKEFLELLPIVVPVSDDISFIKERVQLLTQKTEYEDTLNDEIEQKLASLLELTEEESAYLLNA